MIILKRHEGMKLKFTSHVQTMVLSFALVLDFHVCVEITSVHFCPKSLIRRGSAPNAEI